MDKNRIEGVGKHAAGSIEEAIGKITGNTSAQAEGAGAKAAGKEQFDAGEAGEAGDGVRGVLKR